MPDEAVTVRSRLRLIVAIDLALAGGVLVLVAFVAPEGAVTSDSMLQGFVLAAVISAAPIAALARGVDPTTVIALGGGMVVAGLATTAGGNLLGPVMALAGFLLLIAAGSSEPKPDAGTVGWLLAYAAMLAIAMWLALGTIALSGIPSFLLAVVIATSTRWRNPFPQSDTGQNRHRSS